MRAEGNVSYKIIVHASNPVASLTKKAISGFFLKKNKKWGNGGKVPPVDLGEDSPVREKFSAEIHGKKVAAIKAYWQKQIFTGRDVPPPEKASDRDVLQYVQENDRAIGYLAGSAVLENFNVKVIKIND